jgi:hypothetical protein
VSGRTTNGPLAHYIRTKPVSTDLLAHILVKCIELINKACSCTKCYNTKNLYNTVSDRTTVTLCLSQGSRNIECIEKECVGGRGVVAVVFIIISSLATTPLKCTLYITQLYTAYRCIFEKSRFSSKVTFSKNIITYYNTFHISFSKNVFFLFALHYFFDFFIITNSDI